MFDELSKFKFFLMVNWLLLKDPVSVKSKQQSLNGSMVSKEFSIFISQLKC